LDFDPPKEGVLTFRVLDVGAKFRQTLIKTATVRADRQTEMTEMILIICPCYAVVVGHSVSASDELPVHVRLPTRHASVAVLACMACVVSLTHMPPLHYSFDAAAIFRTVCLRSRGYTVTEVTNDQN